MTTNQNLSAANQIICSNTNPKGELFGFEKCVAFLVPVYPVNLKRTNEKSPLTNVASIQIKDNKDSNGVELQYYKSV